MMSVRRPDYPPPRADPWNAAVTYRCHRFNRIHNCCFDPRPLARNRIGGNVGRKTAQKERETLIPQLVCTFPTRCTSVQNSIFFFFLEQKSLFKVPIHPIPILWKGKRARESGHPRLGDRAVHISSIFQATCFQSDGPFSMLASFPHLAYTRVCVCVWMCGSVHPGALHVFVVF